MADQIGLRRDRTPPRPREESSGRRGTLPPRRLGPRRLQPPAMKSSARRVSNLFPDPVLCSVLSCTLSCPVLCCALSCPVLCSVLSCPVPCPVRSCPVLSGPVLSAGPRESGRVTPPEKRTRGPAAGSVLSARAEPACVCCVGALKKKSGRASAKL